MNSNYKTPNNIQEHIANCKALAEEKKAKRKQKREAKKI